MGLLKTVFLTAVIFALEVPLAHADISCQTINSYGLCTEWSNGVDCTMINSYGACTQLSNGSSCLTINSYGMCTDWTGNGYL